MERHRRDVATDVVAQGKCGSLERFGCIGSRIAGRMRPEADSSMPRRLVRAARRTFELRGYDDTRVLDITGSARVSPGTFYRYFGSKEAVFEVLVNEVAEDAVSGLYRVPAQTDPVQEVVLLVRTYAAQFRRNARLFDADHQRSRGAIPVSVARDEVRGCFAELIHRQITRLRTMAEAVDASAHQVTAQVLGAMVDRVCHLHAVPGGEHDEAAIMAALEIACVRALRPETRDVRKT